MAIKPLVVISQRVHQDSVELLQSVCDVAMADLHSAAGRHEFYELLRQASGLLLAAPERVDERLLSRCLQLRVVACTYRILEHVDISACTRRGIWVTNSMSPWLGKEAELEAARNILDAISGDTPRGALNTVLSNAA